MAPPDPAPDPHAAAPVDPEHPHPFEALPGEERILTVPNVLTLLRLMGLPVFLWLLFGRDQPAAAAAFLAFLSATDWVDGYVARHFDQGSRLGRLFDPTADRILFFVAIGSIIAYGGAPVWFAVVVLVREVTVAAVTVTLLALRYPPVEVTWFGKAGTFGLMFAFPLWLAGSDPDFAQADLCWALGWVAGIPGLALSLVAAVRYVPLWQEAVREGRILKAAEGG